MFHALVVDIETCVQKIVHMKFRGSDPRRAVMHLFNAWLVESGLAVRLPQKCIALLLSLLGCHPSATAFLEEVGRECFVGSSPTLSILLWNSRTISVLVTLPCHPIFLCSPYHKLCS